MRSRAPIARPCPDFGPDSWAPLSSASPSAATVFLRYVGAAGLPQSRQRLPWWPQDCAGPGPLPSALAQPAWRLCRPHAGLWPVLPPRMHWPRPGRCAPGSLPPCPHASFRPLCAPQAQPCAPAWVLLLTRHLTLRALLPPPVRTRACGSRAVAGQHWPAELLGSYLSVNSAQTFKAQSRDLCVFAS